MATAAPGQADSAQQQQTTAAPPPQQQSQPSDLLSQVISATEEIQAHRDKILLQRAELDHTQRLAKMFAKSGLFADVDKDTDGKFLPEDVSIARAAVKIELGSSMGFSAAESMQGIDIIKGRVAVGANLRAARMQRAGFSWPQAIITDDGCWLPLCFQGKQMLRQKVSDQGELAFDEKGNPVMVQVVVCFAKKDAERAGLASKDNYRKDPSSMYFARAVTRAQRRYGPGVLGVDVLDTYEAREIPDEPERARLTLENIKPSSDANRGHDATAPEHETAEPAADAQPVAEEPKQDPPKIIVLEEWPDDPFAAYLGTEIQVGGKWFRRPNTNSDTDWKEVKAPRANGNTKKD